MACLCKNRPICEWCKEKFDSHGQLIIHARIKDGISNCSKNPYIKIIESDYQVGMYRSF